MNEKYPFYGHDAGLVITQPQSGKFVERPMTTAELTARDAALAISKDIYRHANFAGVCYAEIWGLIATAAQQAIDSDPFTLKAVEELTIVEREIGTPSEALKLRRPLSTSCEQQP